MKICKNCNSKIEDDAMVCPYCGCVTKKGTKTRASSNEQSGTRNESSAPKKKRKTWLWVLGWIFIFPVPLTILILRSQKLNKEAKIAIICSSLL